MLRSLNYLKLNCIALHNYNLTHIIDGWMSQVFGSFLSRAVLLEQQVKGLVLWEVGCDETPFSSCDIKK